MKKIGLLCLAVVLALGTMGFAFATWSQTLTITEEVNTGEFCIGVRDVGTDDEGPALGETYLGVLGVLHPTDSPADGTQDPTYTKNVAAARSEDGVEKCTHEGTQYYEDVTETIVNGYPSYECTITLEFANCGTVPAKGSTVTRVTSADPDGLAQFVEITEWEIRDDDDNYVTSGVSVTALETALQAYQLDPCDTMRLDITKHILQEVGTNPVLICPEEGSVTFVEDVTWVQWND